MRESVVREQIQSLHARPKNNREAEDSEAKIIVPLLAKRAYHLPGNGWGRDWWQYMMNNHPLLGICCHHRLHPLKMGQRFIIFIGSIAFGLAITNIVFLWFAFDRELSGNDVMFEFSVVPPNTTAVHQAYQSVEVTRGRLALWTLGGSTHSLFDLSIWYISACSCCHPGGTCATIGCFRNCGGYLVVGVVMVVVALATLAVVWRAAQETQEQYEEEKERLGLDDDASDVPKWGEIQGVGSFSFLMAYAIEVALALFIYFPLFGTVLFSGCCGCGQLPFLGGRPLEVRKEQEKERRKAARSPTPSSDTFDDEIVV